MMTRHTVIISVRCCRRRKNIGMWISTTAGPLEGGFITTISLPVWKMKPELLNLSRIRHVAPMEKTFPDSIDLNAVIRQSYYREPLTLHIINRRNALERAMLHFANYEKNTTKINENTYECRIYYNQTMETELLIETLSFGPMLTVTGNDRFLGLLRTRLQKQRALPAPR